MEVLDQFLKVNLIFCLQKVLDLKDKKEYALKQMVCKDMNEANFCLKEIFNLQSLKHENLIEYKNVFLHESNVGNNLFGKTLYVCVVMPLYQHGDLENLVNTIYLQKGCLDELVSLNLIYIFSKLLILEFN